MGKHDRPEKPQQPNAILHLGARPLPDGNIEQMVIVRLNDCNYQLHKIVTLGEYQITLEGLDLCAKTAIHQAHQRELSAARGLEDGAASSSPRSESAPPALFKPSTGTSTGSGKAPGVPTSPTAPTSGSECVADGSSGQPNPGQPAGGERAPKQAG